MKTILSTIICSFILFFNSSDAIASAETSTECEIFGNLVVNATPAHCGENNGMIEFHLIEDIPCELEFSLDGINWQTANTFENLPPNDYEVLTRIVGEDSFIQFNMTIRAPGGEFIETFRTTYNYENDEGEVYYKLLEGGAPYEVSYFSNNQTTTLTFSEDEFSFTIPNPSSGEYSFSIKNNENCSEKTNSTFIGSGGEIILDSPVVTNAYCGECNATITLYLLQGPAAAIEYSVDGGLTYQDSNFFSGLCINDFLIIAREKNNPTNFEISTAQTINSSSPEISDFDYFCSSTEASLNATFYIEGGISEYKVTYGNPQGEMFDMGIFFDIVHFQIENPIEGDYHFTIEDRVGCAIDTTLFLHGDCLNFNLGDLQQVATDWEIGTHQVEEGTIELDIKNLIQDEQVDLKIFDTFGQLTYYSTLENSSSWNDLIELDSGTYFIILKSKSGRTKVHKQFIF